MYTTLEYLEKCQKEKKSLRKLPNLIKEIKIFVTIFAVAGVFMLIFTNIKLFFWSFVEAFNSNITKSEIVDWNENMDTDWSISIIIQHNAEQMKKVKQMIDDYKQQPMITKSLSTSTESVLKDNLKNYDFNFNTLPPTNRINIPTIGLDVPLITSKYKNVDDFSNWVFDDELENWVVKYPTTPSPWNIGNTLIFGHTSHERRDKNPYWTVFSKIPKLNPGDIIELVWEWKLYKYRVFTTIIDKPSQVNKTYMEYQDKDYLTLMGCYPLGKTSKRMLVIAENIDG